MKRQMEPKIKYAILSLLVITFVVIAVWVLKPNSLHKSGSPANNDNHTDTSNAHSATIATEWLWSKNENRTDSYNDSTRLFPFTSKSVFRALQAVKLDANGNVILDHDALLSLDEALERIYGKLDSESLIVLQQLIKDALPGQAGEQTAKLVGDYYQFLVAKNEFSQINEAMADSNNDMTADSIQANELLYKELQELRKVHLGSGSTNKLFRISDAHAKYMFDSMKLESNQELSVEQKQQMRLEIQEQHISQSINIRDWPVRYQQFKTSKKMILDSELTVEKKKAKLKKLLEATFTIKELEQLAHLGLGRL
jgi:hypothetical protein